MSARVRAAATVYRRTPAPIGKTTVHPEGVAAPLKALQRKLGNRGTQRALSRWIEPDGTENGKEPRGVWPLGGYWVNFDHDLWRNDEAYRDRMTTMRGSSLPAFTTALWFGKDVNGTNDIGDAQGCANCVAADFKGLTLSRFQAMYGNPERKGRNGIEGEAFFESVGIRTGVHRFENVAALVNDIQRHPGGVASGALAWAGHIIRWQSLPDGSIVLWDPQGSLGAPALVPSGVALFLFTFISDNSPITSPPAATGGEPDDPLAPSSPPAASGAGTAHPERRPDGL